MHECREQILCSRKKVKQPKCSSNDEQINKMLSSAADIIQQQRRKIGMLHHGPALKILHNKNK